MLVTTGATPEEYNMLTIAWTGTICTDPPMCYISVRKERHSYDIIRRTGEFCINLTTEAMAHATDWCGVRSGRNEDKWKATGLTPMTNPHVSAPIIAESPLSICCRVREVKELGSHDMFIAEVLGVMVDESLLDPESGKLDLRRAKLLGYAHGEYYALGEKLGTFGWTVKGSTLKKEKKNNRK